MKRIFLTTIYLFCILIGSSGIQRAIQSALELKTTNYSNNGIVLFSVFFVLGLRALIYLYVENLIRVSKSALSLITLVGTLPILNEHDKPPIYLLIFICSLILLFRYYRSNKKLNLKNIDSAYITLTILFILWLLSKGEFKDLVFKFILLCISLRILHIIWRNIKISILVKKYFKLYSLGCMSEITQYITHNISENARDKYRKDLLKRVPVEIKKLLSKNKICKGDFGYFEPKSYIERRNSLSETLITQFLIMPVLKYEDVCHLLDINIAQLKLLVREPLQDDIICNKVYNFIYQKEDLETFIKSSPFFTGDDIRNYVLNEGLDIKKLTDMLVSLRYIEKFDTELWKSNLNTGDDLIQETIILDD